MKGAFGVCLGLISRGSQHAQRWAHAECVCLVCEDAALRGDRRRGGTVNLMYLSHMCVEFSGVSGRMA